MQSKSTIDAHGGENSGSKFFYGYRDGRVLFAVTARDLGVGELGRIVDALAATNDTLGRGVLPRIQAEQWIAGRWEPLTQFDIGQYHYRPAPTDTIRLRFKFAAMRLTYFPDRVEIGPMPDRSLAGLEFGFWRLKDYMPPLVAPIFEGVRARAGEWYVLEFPRLHLPDWLEALAFVRSPWIHDSYRSWYFGSGRPNEPQAVLTHMSIVAPTERAVDFAGRPELDAYRFGFARWPLLPTVNDLRMGVRAAVGYPGEGPVPNWAVDSLRALEARVKTSAHEDK